MRNVLFYTATALIGLISFEIGYDTVAAIRNYAIRRKLERELRYDDLVLSLDNEPNVIEDIKDFIKSL